jgi:hypothetical protein
MQERALERGTLSSDISVSLSSSDDMLFRTSFVPNGKVIENETSVGDRRNTLARVFLGSRPQLVAWPTSRPFRLEGVGR